MSIVNYDTFAHYKYFPASKHKGTKLYFCLPFGVKSMTPFFGSFSIHYLHGNGNVLKIICGRNLCQKI